MAAAIRHFHRRLIFSCVQVATREQFSVPSLFTTKLKHLTNLRALPSRCMSSSTSNKLMEFFDDKDNWPERSVKVGRPWKCEELRLKSNVELHQLWYVLLKERNMLLTMEAEYKRLCELMPSPERIEKVEESMENVLLVTAERDRAVNLLETGQTGEPDMIWAKNEIGLAGHRHPSEHYVPREINTAYLKRDRLHGKWVNRYLRQFREKKLRQMNYFRFKEQKDKQKLKELFPDAEFD